MLLYIYGIISEWERKDMELKRRIRFYWKCVKRSICKKLRGKERIVVICILLLLAGGLMGGQVSKKVVKNREEKKTNEKIEKLQKERKEEVAKIQKELDAVLGKKKEERPWYLILVNKDHPMEEGYKPELTELEPDYSVDARIAEAAKKMLADAKAAGLRINMCSAYRSVNRQKQLFNESVEERLSWGLEYWDAFENTRQSVAEPGTSEHALGLALDLISDEYTELDKGQEETKEAKWLAENCHKYGFILRYPPAKTDITGIIYEPWHYRYVGVEDATKIMELGITLEEYLQEYY